MRNISFRTWTIPLALLLLCLVSFAPLIPWLGFYWDDWPTIWSLHFFGPQGFKEAFSIDRPYLAYLFMLTTRIVGESTLGWQLFAIFTRWLSCLAFWWTLWSIWPKHKTQVTWATFLFAIYPGFSQQYISVTYSHAFIVLGLFLLSLGTMIWAYRKPSLFWPLIVFSLATSAISMFIAEYNFGLELLRPVLLWMVLDEVPDAEQIHPRKRIQKAIIRWLPYTVLMALFLVWRTVLSDTQRGEIQIFDRLRSNPLLATLDLAQTILGDFVEVSFIAWAQILNFTRLEKLSVSEILIYAGIALFTAILTIFYLTNLRPGRGTGQEISSRTGDNWGIQAVLIGTYALLVGGWPFWATYLPIKLRFPLDRFTLAMMFGASLLMVGLLEMLIRNYAVKIFILGAAIGLAAGLHFQTAIVYREAWEFQKNFFWQLAWRAPAIEPGTLLLTPELPFIYYSDNSLTAPLNWTYAPDNDSLDMHYLMFDIEARLGNALTRFAKDIPIELKYRLPTFYGSTSKVVTFFFAPPRCVTIIDPTIEQYIPDKPRYIPKALALSDPELIDRSSPNPASPPIRYFAPEPVHGWCYYFEKADLARQIGAWEDVARLGDQAIWYHEELFPDNAVELIPFIEGYAHTEQWDQAVIWSFTAYKLNPDIKEALCETWLTLQNTTTSNTEQGSALKQVQSELQCSFRKQ